MLKVVSWYLQYPSKKSTEASTWKAEPSVCYKLFEKINTQYSQALRSNKMN